MEKVREIVATALIKFSVVQVDSHLYLPGRSIIIGNTGLDCCRLRRRTHLDCKVLDEPLVTTVAGCVHKPPAQVVLA